MTVQTAVATVSSSALQMKDAITPMMTAKTMVIKRTLEEYIDFRMNSFSSKSLGVKLYSSSCCSLTRCLFFAIAPSILPLLINL